MFDLLPLDIICLIGNYDLNIAITLSQVNKHSRKAFPEFYWEEIAKSKYIILYRIVKSSQRMNHPLFAAFDWKCFVISQLKI